jgi:hypothetical protein
MKSTTKVYQFTAIYMTVLMVLIAGPYQAALAALVPTQAAVDSADASKARATIKDFLARQDAQSELVSRGIDPAEAKARIDSLTDAEAMMVAKHVESMPAGGNAVGILVGALLLVFIILLITDLVGVTDVFPFVKKHR